MPPFWTSTCRPASVALSYEPGGDERLRYATRGLQVRLHQRSFRERVPRAYRSRCAVFGFRHHELLDATHMVPDSETGAPRVPNGLARVVEEYDSTCLIARGANAKLDASGNILINLAAR